MSGSNCIEPIRMRVCTIRHKGLAKRVPQRKNHVLYNYLTNQPLARTIPPLDYKRRSVLRAALQALGHRGVAEIYSRVVREKFRLGPASSVQKALQSLDWQDILDRYRGEYFFLDPLLPY
jgi:hypothetical protein